MEILDSLPMDLLAIVIYIALVRPDLLFGKNSVKPKKK